MEAVRIGARPGTPEGIEGALRLAEEFPNEAEVWQVLSSAYWLNEDFASAAAVMQKAIDLEPQESLWFYYRAEAKSKLDDFAGAVENLTEAIHVCDPIERATLLQRLYFWRADMFLQLGRKAEARADLEHAPDVFALRTTRIRERDEMLAECDA
jgi:tetratricopeptide (TPR) repeat protein